MSGGTSHLDESGIAIVGVGLIGGSIAAALKARGYAGPVLGFGRSGERLRKARDAGLLDEFATSPAPLVERASLVVVCTPVDRIVADVREFAAAAKPGTLITDAGSVKGSICAALADDGIKYIGSHPMAGSEKNGFEHADAGLFEGRLCLFTPRETDDHNDVARIERFWEFLKMRVLRLAPEDHDRAVAYSSHLPHVAASALSILLPADFRGMTAGGFRDTTRIAAGHPDLWDDILRQNSEEVIEALDRYAAVLAEFRDCLESGDSEGLQKLLEKAKTNRDALDEEEVKGEKG